MSHLPADAEQRQYILFYFAGGGRVLGVSLSQQTYRSLQTNYLSS
jgi:hypothetical protein